MFALPHLTLDKQNAVKTKLFLILFSPSIMWLEKHKLTISQPLYVSNVCMQTRSRRYYQRVESGVHGGFWERSSVGLVCVWSRQFPCCCSGLCRVRPSAAALVVLLEDDGTSLWLCLDVWACCSPAKFEVIVFGWKVPQKNVFSYWSSAATEEWTASNPSETLLTKAFVCTAPFPAPFSFKFYIFSPQFLFILFLFQ